MTRFWVFVLNLCLLIEVRLKYYYGSETGLGLVPEADIQGNILHRAERLQQ